MNEQEALSRMVAPGTRRKGKYREGVIQIHITRACDKACFGCTQGSNLRGVTEFMSPDHFEQAVLSLGFGTHDPYFGVVGVFGGNPALSPHFDVYCEILQRLVPFNQRGLWCNNPVGRGRIMRATFDPSVSNLNVHLDQAAHDEFRRDWPEARPFGLDADSRHSPPYVAMKDVLRKQCPTCFGMKVAPDNSASGYANDGTSQCSTCGGIGQVYDEEKAWQLISQCDINQHWSAMIGVFRNQLRAWFCEVAGAQAMLHQWDGYEGHTVGGIQYSYPDTGIDPTATHAGNKKWWELPLVTFTNQVRKHCHECGVPLRGYGELAQATGGVEQVSATHENVYSLKKKGRLTQIVTNLEQLGVGRLQRVTDYMGNAKR